MPIRTGNIIKKGKEQPKKVAPTNTSGINNNIRANNFIVKNKPKLLPESKKVLDKDLKEIKIEVKKVQPKKVQPEIVIPEKYKTETEGELIKRINTKSQYMVDVLNLDQN